MVSLEPRTLETLSAGLKAAQEEFVARFPGDSGARQPVSVIYGGAQLYKAESAQKLGALARQSLATYAPDAASLGEALNLPLSLSEKVHPRVVAKLEREAVEDQRIDFEDGYGHRSDEEEDAHALAAAKEVARAHREGLLPPFWGIRVKPMSAELGLRGIRTLDLFLTELKQPALVTLPKVVSVGQVRVFVAALTQLEKKLGFPPRSLRIEFMV
ncbi:MAG TPA: phosphoenolpyruvate kinase, partial [Archangium sp.]